MSTDTVDTDSIGPQLSLGDVAFPVAVGERLATLYGREAPVETAAEWVAAMDETIRARWDRPATVDDLCAVVDGDHSFAGGGETQSYICVLDPLVYPFLTGTPGTVRSETPVRGETVTFEIGEADVEASHDDAVVSIGVADDVGDADDVSAGTMYRQVCAYVQTFADEAEYETWAADVDAATTPLPAATGVAVARELAGTLFQGDE